MTNGDVAWYLPNRKRPVAYTTRAEADCLKEIFDSGMARS